MNSINHQLGSNDHYATIEKVTVKREDKKTATLFVDYSVDVNTPGEYG